MSDYSKEELTEAREVYYDYQSRLFPDGDRDGKDLNDWLMEEMDLRSDIDSCFEDYKREKWEEFCDIKEMLTAANAFDEDEE